MGTVSDFCTNNLSSKNPINLSTEIKAYITRRQRATFKDISMFVYRTIGTKYDSSEMDEYIRNILNDLVRENFTRLSGHYYVLCSLVPKD